MEYKELIKEIIEKELGEPPLEIKRIVTGLCNEVFSVSLQKQTVVIRLHEDGNEMRGSEKFIPFFRSLGIKVPNIMSSDYSKKNFSLSYQILSKIEGKDIGQVIQDFNGDQLKDIAKEIANIFHQLGKLPTNGRFGWFSYKSKMFRSWVEFLEKMLEEIQERNRKTEVVGENLINEYKRLLNENKDYFSTVKSVCYFDDLCTKNVMVNEGSFSGLVDLDGVGYGDFLESVGRIKASWFGTFYGDTYTKAIEDELQLNDKQRQIVTVYAILNRIYWLSEKGIKFNENTSENIDWGSVASDKKVIDSLLLEYTHK